MSTEARRDPSSGTVVHVVTSRQARPNLPSAGCPFCVGGLEAPEPYDVLHFPNRWPAMDGDRCEVVLYTPQHEATFWSLGVDGARLVIDRWADRTADLGARDDVDYVLVFENRGAEVGATIAHPHGQIYAYDHVPARQSRRLAAPWRPDPDPGERLVADHDGWRAWVPYAPTHPIALEVAPDEQVVDLPSMSAPQRDGMAAMLVDVLARLDRLFDTPLPYMLWLNQGPTSSSASAAGGVRRGRGGKDRVSVGVGAGRTGGADAEPWFNVEIVSPWRAKGVARYIAAAEVASDEYFNPVAPEDLAARLRELA